MMASDFRTALFLADIDAAKMISFAATASNFKSLLRASRCHRRYFQEEVEFADLFLLIIGFDTISGGAVEADTGH